MSSTNVVFIWEIGEQLLSSRITIMFLLTLFENTTFKIGLTMSLQPVRSELSLENVLYGREHE